MPRSEYEELKEFLSVYTARYMPIDQLPPELRPMACLEQLERTSRSKASQGVRQAVNDIVEQCRHVDPSQLVEMDQHMRWHGVVTVSELRRRFSRHYAAILKRGTIRNETEYYLVRGIVDNSASAAGRRERARLSRMLQEFEKRG